MSGFELYRLDCPSCGSAIAAEGDDTVYYCVSCRNGYVFTRFLAPAAAPAAGSGAEVVRSAARLLQPVEVAFVAAPGVQAERFLPFWLLPARVRIHERHSSGAGNLLKAAFGGSSEGAGPPGPETEGTFAIPAFPAELDRALALAARYTRELPGLGERLGERLTGGTLSVDDAKKLAHYGLIAVEAGKPDMLANLRYDIDFGPPRLLGVPFVRQGEAWVDARFGLPA